MFDPETILFIGTPILSYVFIGVLLILILIKLQKIEQFQKWKQFDPIKSIELKKKRGRPRKEK